VLEQHHQNIYGWFRAVVSLFHALLAVQQTCSFWSHVIPQEALQCVLCHSYVVQLLYWHVLRPIWQRLWACRYCRDSQSASWL
jgi:hypothetical protein